jgi:hypothetical protein
VTSNSVLHAVDSIALTGTGQAGGITVTPTSRTFTARRSGLLGLGGTTQDQTITVASTGPGLLLITSVQITAAATNSAPGNYSVQANTCGTAARAVGPPNCTITVRFAPNAGANTSRNATLSIGTNAPTTPTTVALVGTGT